MHFKKAAILVLSLSGCASVPDVTYNYYPARWSSSVTVTQTVGCAASKKKVLTMHAFSVATSYSSDLGKEPFSIRVKDLDRWSGDVDFTMTLTDDGRLRGVNQSSTGQGEALVKSVIALEAAIAAVPFATSLSDVDRSLPTEKDCQTIDRWGDKKPITIIYRGSFSEKDRGTSVPLKVSSESKAIYDELSRFLPTFSVDVDKVDQVKEIQSRPDVKDGDSSTVPLTLQKLGSLGIRIKQEGSSSDTTVYSSRVLTPLSETYSLPIPKAALFGKQSFSLALSEAGAITSIGYGRNTGAVGALNSLGALANTQTAATDAAEAKAQADLIAQQQRLMLCMTKPDQCK